jgi:hypothetical protein
MKQLSFLLLIATLLSTTHAFLQTGSTISSASGCSRSRAVSGALFSTVADEEAAVKKNDALLKRDRYVATNRFTVRQGRAAKFEKRWGKFSIVWCASSSSLCALLLYHLVSLSLSCHFFSCSRSFFFSHQCVLFFHNLPADRSSRLAELDGFKYFQLMRRVGLDNEANSGESSLSLNKGCLFLIQ